MKKITYTYTYNWKSVLILIAIAILLIPVGFASELNIPFGTVIVLLVIVICLGICFYNNYYSKESFRDWFNDGKFLT